VPLVGVCDGYTAMRGLGVSQDVCKEGRSADERRVGSNRPNALDLVSADNLFGPVAERAKNIPLPHLTRAL